MVLNVILAIGLSGGQRHIEKTKKEKSMKLRNFIIVLLAVLMAFAFASCKNDPQPTPPGPTPPGPTGDVYQVEITEGVDKDYWNRDKLKFVWGEAVDEGDVISLKYRSERDVYQWDIRDENSKVKWVYESSKNGFVDPVLGDDGWYTLTYTLPATDINGAEIDYDAIQQFGIYFRGNYVTTDLFEIKDITLNGYPLEVESGTIISKAKLNEEPVEHDWTKKNYAVLFATGTPGSVDKTPIAEKVPAGGKVTGAPIAKEGYTLTIYNDTAHTSIFDPETPINSEMIFYYEYVGIPRTVRFETNGGTEIDPVTVANGDMLEAPAEPEKEGVAFKAWYKEAELINEWNFIDPVLGDMTLYAGYGEPVEVTFQLNGGVFPEGIPSVKVVAKGNPVAYPAADPTNGSKMFLGWYADAEFTTLYDFTLPVEEPTSIYAAWIEATKVTLVDGDKVEIIDVPLDVPMDAPDVVDDKIGYVFGGWYDDADLTVEHDFTANVTEPFTIFAGWEEATLYQLKSTHNTEESIYDFDKFTIQYSDGKVNAGDILSFRYRSTTDFTFFSIRGDKKWVYENTSATRGMTTYETKEDGWTYVTYEFAAKDTSGADIPADAWWRFDFGSRTIVIGDILEIQDWTLNGEPLAIEAENLTKYVQPTVKIIEGGSYLWEDLEVSFVTGEHAAAIDPETVEFGSTIDAPEIKLEEGYAFAGWYTDELFAEEYNFALPIIEDEVIHAKIGEAMTVTFDTNGGSEIDPVVLAKGETVAKPADPTSDGYVFGGWFTENTFDNEYDFTTAVEDNITLYAKWISSKKLTLNLNYTGAPAATSIDVEASTAIAVPKNPTRLGYYFGGWYTEATCENAFDFEAGIIVDTDIYAKWDDPVTYLCTSTVAETRWQFRWHEDTVEMFNGKIQAGDVFTLEVKFPDTNTLAENYWRLRVRSGEAHITENVSFATTTKTEDGWYQITVTVPETIKDGKGLYLQVYGAGEVNWPVGSQMLIRGFAYNGNEIPIDAKPYGQNNTHKGAYEKVAPNVEVYNPIPE
jgi:uncharacterized repeat protein (TIGR02543 family)